MNLGDGIIPTFLTYEVTKYEKVLDENESLKKMVLNFRDPSLTWEPPGLGISPSWILCSQTRNWWLVWASIFNT